jgi:hypothetical protein
MARAPNYAWERKDRDRIKAAKARTKPADETESTTEE